MKKVFTLSLLGILSCGIANAQTIRIPVYPNPVYGGSNPVPKATIDPILGNWTTQPNSNSCIAQISVKPHKNFFGNIVDNQGDVKVALDPVLCGPVPISIPESIKVNCYWGEDYSTGADNVYMCSGDFRRGSLSIVGYSGQYTVELDQTATAGGVILKAPLVQSSRDLFASNAQQEPSVNFQGHVLRLISLSPESSLGYTFGPAYTLAQAQESWNASFAGSPVIKASDFRTSLQDGVFTVELQNPNYSLQYAILGMEQVNCAQWENFPQLDRSLTKQLGIVALILGGNDCSSDGHGGILIHGDAVISN